jgi:predicted RNase H-like nuclease (RuvC/YqgF family)
MAELFKKNRGRPKDINSEKVVEAIGVVSNSINSIEEKLQLPSSEGTQLKELQKINEDLKDQLVKLADKYLKMVDSYEQKLKTVKVKKQPENEALKLENSIKTLYNKFQDIASGNNKFHTKFDSVKIYGINGILDEFRKYFPTINFTSK